MATPTDFDLDPAHDADMRALRAEQLACDIDLDHELCTGCQHSLRACACCHACGGLVDAHGQCGCIDEDEAHEADMMARHLAEIEEEERQANARLFQPAPCAHDPHYHSQDPHKDLAEWRAARAHA